MLSAANTQQTLNNERQTASCKVQKKNVIQKKCGKNVLSNKIFVQSTKLFVFSTCYSTKRTHKFSVQRFSPTPNICSSDIILWHEIYVRSIHLLIWNIFKRVMIIKLNLLKQHFLYRRHWIFWSYIPQSKTPRIILKRQHWKLNYY